MEQPEHVCASSDVNHSAATSVSGCEQVSLDDLSDDILVPIIRWVGIGGNIVAERRSRRALFNLALCSRRFQQLAEPELYSQFRQSCEPLSSRPQFLCLFLRRILARPDLARCLRRLTCTARSNHPDFLLPVESELTAEDWTRIHTVVNATSRSEDEADRWINAVKVGQWDAAISLLLSVTPNLEELELNDWSFRYYDYEHLLDGLERAQTLQDSCEESLFSMSKLRSFSVNFDDYTLARCAFGNVIPFLKLKSVQTFSGHLVCQEDCDSEKLVDLILNNSLLKLTTKDLAFSLSVIGHNSMVIILSCFPQLERFYYEFGLAGLDVFEPPRLMAALKHLKSCLKDLTLISNYWDGESKIESYPIGSLAGFQKLVSIRANASIMTGELWSDEEGLDDDDPDAEGFAKTQNLVDAVPPTLESLSLLHCSNHVVRHIFELVSQKPWRTPALRKVDLGWEAFKYPDKDTPREPTRHPGFTKEEARKLISECEAADIEIVITYLTPMQRYVSFWDPRTLRWRDDKVLG